MDESRELNPKNRNRMKHFIIKNNEIGMGKLVLMYELRFMLCECVRKEEREDQSGGWMCDVRPSTGSGTWLRAEVQRGGEMGVIVGRKRGKDPRLRQRMERRKAA